MYLLLGEAPNPATVGRPQQWLRPDTTGIPHTANRLREITGYSHTDYLRVFSIRDNVLPSIPRAWNAETIAHARTRARAVAEIALDRGVHGVFCLGRRASAALMPEVPADGLPPLTWRPIVIGPHEAIACYVPHTSGRNTYWNEPAHIETARQFFGTIGEIVRTIHEAAMRHRASRESSG